MSKKIAVVEDEAELASLIEYNLTRGGFQPRIFNGGEGTFRELESWQPDLIVLDVMLPAQDGFDLCRRIRQAGKLMRTPVIFLTARSDEVDRVLGLEIGGDDYITKPFNLEEFLLRVKALIKRGMNKEEKAALKDTFRFNGFEVNFLTYEITGKDRKKIRLTKKEIMLLKLLIERRNEVVSREQILETVWGYDIYPSTRTVDNFILSFRKYFEKDPKQPKYFFSIRGVGYKFMDE